MSNTLENRILDGLVFLIIGPKLKPYSKARISGSKSKTAAAAAPYGLVIKDLNWDFAGSPKFKNLLQLKIELDTWPEPNDLPIDDISRVAYAYLKQDITCARMTFRDDGREPFVETMVYRIVEYVSAQIQVALIQSVMINAVKKGHKVDNVEFLKYIFSLNLVLRGAVGSVIPDIHINLGTTVLGTIELKGTRFNSLRPNTAPRILTNWFDKKEKVDPKWGSHGEVQHAWSILAQLVTQADKSAHKIGVFTSLIGALYVYRFEKATEDGTPDNFYVSANLAEADDDYHRADSKTAVNFTHQILAFMFKILLAEEDFSRYWSMGEDA